MLDERSGLCVCRVTGRNAEAAFRNESGGHRWQRIPPTEKRGRTQTSTVTVVVLPEPTRNEVRLEERDLSWDFFRGSGKGGQNRNKLETAVRLTHRPTGIAIRVETERKREQNRNIAREMMLAKLCALQREKRQAKVSNARKEQAGSGMRGDKVRTIRMQDGIVTCHLTDRKTSWTKYARGDWSDIQG